jgi:hypothetical protein
MAAAIRFAKLSTVVASGSMCASACFLAFAAGEQKFAAPGALIGVHKASDKGGVETKQSGAATVIMSQFARGLGVPSSIISQMVTTPPTQIVWLGPRDLRAMDVKTLSAYSQLRQAVAASERVLASQPPPTSDDSSGIATAGRPSWSEFIEKAIVLSARQNDGAAVLSRSCKAESKECSMVVAYELPDGRQGLALALQDGSGNITRREVCESNAFNDVRDCVNWDTGAKYRDIKDTTGAWVQSVGAR